MLSPKSEDDWFTSQQEVPKKWGTLLHIHKFITYTHILQCSMWERVGGDKERERKEGEDLVHNAVSSLLESHCHAHLTLISLVRNVTDIHLNHFNKRSTVPVKQWPRLFQKIRSEYSTVSDLFYTFSASWSNVLYFKSQLPVQNSVI